MLPILKKYWYVVMIGLVVLAGLAVFLTSTTASESDQYYENEWQPVDETADSAGWRGKVVIEYADGSTENLKLLQMGKTFKLFDIFFPGQPKPVTGIRYSLDTAVQSSKPDTQVILDFKDFYLHFEAKAVGLPDGDDIYSVDYKYTNYDYKIVNCYVGSNKQWVNVIDSRIPITFFLKDSYIQNPCLLTIKLQPSGKIHYRTLYKGQYGEWHDVPNLPVSVTFNLESKPNIYEEPQINIFFRSGTPAE